MQHLLLYFFLHLEKASFPLIFLTEGGKKRMSSAQSGFVTTTFTTSYGGKEREREMAALFLTFLCPRLHTQKGAIRVHL